MKQKGNEKGQNKNPQNSHYQHRLTENPLPPFQPEQQMNQMNLQIKIKTKNISFNRKMLVLQLNASNALIIFEILH